MKRIDKPSELKDRMVYKIIKRSDATNIEDDIMEYYAKYTERTAYFFIFEPLDGSTKILLTPDSYAKKGQITLYKNQWIAYEFDPEEFPEYYV
jgi:hypothetical protein